jgi:circadian clock protein KaiB
MTRPVKFKFRLYITGNAPNSVQALSNLTDWCRCHLQNRPNFEVIDLLTHPARALADQVFMTPTLVKLSPKPELRVVGALSDLSHILDRLGVSKSVKT